MKHKIYKNLRDFDFTYLDKNFNYHIWGIKDNFKKNDTIFIDLCIFKNSHTYIKGIVKKVCKHKIVISYQYL